jgi:Coenzyme PQQ synthesis protein D (PqqD)
MISLNSFPKRKDQVIAQKAASDFLLFNMDNGSYYSLNEVGSRIWELCDGKNSVAQVVATVAAEYDSPGNEVQNDILELLEELRSGKLIVETVTAGPVTR